MALEAVDLDLLVRILFALGIGGLIGIERERGAPDKTVLAGIRTLPLVALTGVILVALAQLSTWWILVVGTGIMGLLAWQLAVARGKHGFAGLTTPVAFVITYLAGVVTGFGLLVEAAAIGLVTVLLLFEKKALHRFADVLSPEEIRGAIVFLALSVILFPIIPSGAVDPWGAIVPRQVLLVVILVSAISFLGFLAMRILGASRGLVASAVLAGFVNSTAASGSLAALARDAPSLLRLATRGVILALLASVLRNLAIATAADPTLTLVRHLLPFALIMMVVLAVWAWRRGNNKTEPPQGQIEVRSPFAWWPALKFAMLFIAFSVVAAASQQLEVGRYAIYITALGGLVSTGAVLASMAVLSGQGVVGGPTAAAVSLLAIVFSMTVKPAVVRAICTPLYRAMLAPTAVTLLVGLVGAVFWIVWP